MRFQGKLYRALNPIWAREPLSGAGAARRGGRFNLLGVPTLYCATAPMTALREANQVGDLQPTTLVAYDADVDPVFDARSDARAADFGMTMETLADPYWREAMRATGEARTQRIARRLIEEGYAGLIVPSFARGATSDALNLVLWKWGPELPARLTLIDDERRLD